MKKKPSESSAQNQPEAIKTRASFFSPFSSSQLHVTEHVCLNALIRQFLGFPIHLV